MTYAGAEKGQHETDGQRSPREIVRRVVAAAALRKLSPDQLSPHLEELGHGSPALEVLAEWKKKGD
jgi:hypothetical protein